VAIDGRIIWAMPLFEMDIRGVDGYRSTAYNMMIGSKGHNAIMLA